MLDQDIIAEQAVRRERESFRKRRFGLVKKNEQLKRVWPFCDIEQKIHDHATGQYYLFQTSNVDFPSISELQKNSPHMIAELLNSNDFMTDDDDSNNDDDGDSNGEIRVTRRKMKNIRQRRRSLQTTPKKKIGKDMVRRPAARVPAPTFIKDIVSRNKQDKVGTGRCSPQISRNQKPEVERSESAGPARKKNSTRRAYILPPIPILKSGEETPMIAETVSDMASEMVL
ncbi:hypothetical protein B0J14DRAFT_113917 [Halenospora varia]|nr:hypothetical protein B0J14DRAFT_113917 [Halenospora varia]